MKLALLAVVCIFLSGCSVYQPAYDKLHEDVFGCPPADKQDREYKNNPDMESILNLPKCDNPKPVYVPPGA